MMLDLGLHLSERRLQEVQVRQHLLQQQPMVRLELPLQRLAQRGQFGSQAPPRQLRQRFGVMVARHQSMQHRPSALAQYIGGHRRQLNVAQLEYLVHAVDLL
jgi:hypothetical protein